MTALRRAFSQHVATCFSIVTKHLQQCFKYTQQLCINTIYSIGLDHFYDISARPVAIDVNTNNYLDCSNYMQPKRSGREGTVRYA